MPLILKFFKIYMKDQSIATIIFSDNREKVLLIKRRDVPVWVLPGGGIEECEKLKDAAIRETFEETGYRVEIIKKVGEYFPINKLTKHTHLYECKILSGKASIGDETKDINFFNIKKLPKYLPEPYVLWIKDAYKKHPYLIKKKLDLITYRLLFKYFLKYPHLVFRFLLTRIGIYINS